MLHHVIHVLVVALAVLLTAKVVPGVRVRSFGGAVVFAVVLAILNKLLYGVLVFLSLPLILLTFGLFLIVINAFLYWLADKLVGGVEVDSFGAAVLGSLVTSMISWLMMFILR
jgi:putative membrane protein